jgi:L-alanine-DL-glutamate epimerase-like enolase superfamily enzyme
VSTSPQKGTDVKITGLRTLCATRLHRPQEQWITDRYRSVKADIAVVVVDTDGGLTGIGEACSYGNPRMIADWVAWYAPFLAGRDLDDVSTVPRPTGTAADPGSPSAHDFAVAGIDCALWDLRGRAAGLPVRAMLAAKSDDSVRMYASGGVCYDWRHDPHTLVDDVRGYVADGYDLVKIRLGTHWGWDGVTPDRFLRLLDEVRGEVGDGVQFAVDANSRLSREEALALAGGLSDRGIRWLEEPLAKDDLAGYVWLQQRTDLTISGGESLTTIEQFRPWLEAGALDIVQPDAGVCGISEVMRIGQLAERHGARLVPHSWHNGLMAMANAHAVAALPNADLLEDCMVQGPLKWGVIRGGSPVREATMKLPDAPGLGVDLIDDLESAFPYIEGHYSIEVFR